MFSSALAAILRLLLFRAGPEDFPYAPSLTQLLVPLATLVNYLLLAQALPASLAAAMSLAVVIGTGVGTRVLLRARGLEARFMQTYHALLAANSVLTLALWLPFSEIAPQLRELASDPGALEAGKELQVPAWAALMMNALNLWNFAVNAHIYRRAANFGLGGGILVAVAVAFAVLMFALFFASVVSMVVGAGPKG